VVFGVDGHTMSLFLVSDDVVADLQDQFVIGIEFIKLRTAGWFTLECPEITFRIQGHGRDTAWTRRQDVRIGEYIAQRLVPFNTLQRLTSGSHTIPAY